jgi:Family of unknown function (DUF6159)
VTDDSNICGQPDSTATVNTSGRGPRGWRIAKASATVLKRHPSLLLFPAIAGAALVAVTASIGLSVHIGAGRGVGQHLSDGARAAAAIAIGFAWYYACIFTVVFCNAALISCAMQYMANEPTSVRAGLAAAGRRLPQILGWALIVTIVGTLLNVLNVFLKDKLGLIGTLIGGVADTAWAVLTYFVVPALVVEKVSPFKAVSRSSTILRQTWGESLSGAAGLGLIQALLLLPAIGLGVGAMKTHGGDAVALGAIAAVYALTLTVVFATLGAIFRAGVYIYATSRSVPTGFDPGVVQTAFRTK